MRRTSFITLPSMVGIVGCTPAVDEKLWCFLVGFLCVTHSRFGITKFVITETLWSSVIFKTIMLSLHRGRFVVVLIYIRLFLWTPKFSLRSKFIPKIAIFRDFWGHRPTLFKPERWNLAWGCGPRAPFSKLNFVF